MHLTIHCKTTEGGLIKEPSILVSYINRDNDSILTKMLRHRKVDKPFLLSRRVEAKEFNDNAPKHRIHLMSYKNWDGLIEDEKNYTSNESYLAELEALKIKYPQFN